jgi:WD40 repeat protein/uncharacterized membrane protein (GlpM family)
MECTGTHYIYIYISISIYIYIYICIIYIYILRIHFGSSAQLRLIPGILGIADSFNHALHFVVVAMIDAEQLRAGVVAALTSYLPYLATLSIGGLRADLETHLGLEPNSLLARKDEVQTILKQELKNIVSKPQQTQQGEEPSRKEHKKESEEDCEGTQNRCGKKRTQNFLEDKKVKKAKKDAASSHEAKHPPKETEPPHKKDKDQKNKKVKKAKKDAASSHEAKHPPKETEPPHKKDKDQKDKKVKKAKKDAASSHEAKHPPKETEPPAPVTLPEPESEALLATPEPAEAPLDDPMDDPMVVEAVEAAAAMEEAEAEAAAAAVDVAPTEAQVLALRNRTSGWALSGAEDGCLRLWNLHRDSCDRVLEGHVGAVVALVVNWDEMQAVSGAEDGARLWDLRQGGCQKAYACVEEDGAEGGCTAVAVDWNSTSTRVLGGCGDGKLRLWSMRSGELQKHVAAHPGGVWALQVNWKTQRAASGGDDLLKIWNLENWSCLQKIDGHLGGITCLAYDWHENRALVGAGGKSLRLWRTNERAAKLLVGHQDLVSVVFADWGDDVAITAGWDAQLRLWNLKKETVTSHVDCKFGRVRSMAADMEQMQAICGSSNGCLHHLDLKTGEELRLMEGHVGGVTAVQARL